MRTAFDDGQTNTKPTLVHGVVEMRKLFPIQLARRMAVCWFGLCVCLCETNIPPPIVCFRVNAMVGWSAFSRCDAMDVRGKTYY